MQNKNKKQLAHHGPKQKIGHIFSHPFKKGHFIIIYFAPKVIFSEKPVQTTKKTYPKVKRAAA